MSFAISNAVYVCHGTLDNTIINAHNLTALGFDIFVIAGSIIAAGLYLGLPTGIGTIGQTLAWSGIGLAVTMSTADIIALLLLKTTLKNEGLEHQSFEAKSIECPSIKGDWYKGYEIADIQQQAFPERDIPIEIVPQIFSFLKFQDLGRILCVSKQWCVSASSPIACSKIRSWIDVIDQFSWQTHVDLKTYGLFVVDEPSFDINRDLPLLKKGLSLKIEDKKGITWLTIPKGLSINKLVRIGEALSGKYLQKIFRPYLIKECKEIEENTEVDKTYRIVITNTILESSRSLKSIEAIREFMARHPGCRQQALLETIALCVMTFIATGKRLYKETNPKKTTFTYCTEQNGDSSIIVGVYTNGSHLGITEGFMNSPYEGVGVVVQEC